MIIEAVCEYNDDGFLIYCANFPGAYVRGETENQALSKFASELRSYLLWIGAEVPKEAPQIEIVQRKHSLLQVCQADSDVLFDSEKQGLSEAEYQRLKILVLRSARDFNKIYAAIENPNISDRPLRSCFYGNLPRTPQQMYEHTNQTTAYYAAAFGIDLVNMPDIYANRVQILSEVESLPDFLSDRIYIAPDGEQWTVRKLLRRLLWHDRIHAKALWRTATSLWGSIIPNPFFFI